MSDKPDVLTVAGLPPLSWERKSGWRCETALPGWSGFASPAVEAAARIPVSFDCPDIYARTPPSAAQVAAFNWLVGPREAERDATLQAFYNDLREWVGGSPDLVHAITEELGRPLANAADLLRLVALNDVSIDAEDEAGVAPVTLEFVWVWEDEHEAFVATWVGGRLDDLGPR